MQFTDRFQAGRFLASHLLAYQDQPDVLILGLPRGGVAVAGEVAALLRVPWDILVVRKIGLPGHRELAIGAIASGGVQQLQLEMAESFGVSRQDVQKVLAEETKELERREHQLRHDRPYPPIAGRRIIVVDDGLATGWTMRAALTFIRHRHPAQISVAVPVGARETCLSFHDQADEVICAYVPETFEAVGQFYLHFDQLTDTEVEALLPPLSAPARSP